MTDVPLTDAGVEVATALRSRLDREGFDAILTSPRQRARRTAELAGFGDAQVEEDLVEWAYGDYEGITTEEIRRTVPGWTVWTHPTPGGETAEEVTARLDRLVHRLGRSQKTLVFGHGHSLRGLAARWVGLPVTEGRLLTLATGTVSVLGRERETPVLTRWNC